MHSRLDYFPRQQAALLPVGRESWAVELEHILGGEVLQIIDRFAVHLFQQHRRRGLANHAPLAGEIQVVDLPFVVQLQLNPHHVAAQRVLVLVRVGRCREGSPMKRVLVVVEDVFLVEFFFGGHGNFVVGLKLAS